MSSCSNCGATLVGAFCHECGQKRFVDSHRRFSHLIHLFLTSATDLDGRVWRTLRALLFRPGLLSREYIDGRRARWLSPVSLFLAISVVYFVSPLHGGDFTLQFNQQVTERIRTLAAAPNEKFSDAQLAMSGQRHSPFTESWIDSRVHERDAAVRKASDGASGYSYHDYRIAYDAKADDVSKALVILHVPFAALALMLMFFRQRHYYAEHFVVALHFFTFWMISLVAVTQARALLNLLPAAWTLPDSSYDWFMRVLLPMYAVFTLRRAYAVGWFAAGAAVVGWLVTILAVNLYLYRALQFVVTFALT